MHVPMRTCVGCREVAAKAVLARVTFAAATGELVLGVGREHQPGRGAYVHRRTTCIANATRGGFARSLRRAIPPAAVRGLATELSPTDDNPSQKRAGLEGQTAVETRLGSATPPLPPNEEG